MKNMTREELDLFLTTVGKHSANEQLMFRVMFNHGLRVSEAINLDKNNVVSGHLVVQRLKGSAKTAQPLLDDEKSALETLAAHDGRFFPMSRVTVWRKMQAYCAEAGIPEFKAHPHILKHTTGRLGYLGGMGLPEVQTYLGHKNGGNTMIYMQAGEDEASNAFMKAVKK